MENLNMVAKGLVDEYRVTSVDVRNHGDSFHKNDMAYPSLARDIIELMDQLSISKAHILGHSMGGKVAMEVALSYPERVNKLVIADISPVQYPAHHQQIINGLKAIDFSRVNSRKDADEQLAAFVEEPSVRAFLLRNLGVNDGQYFFKCALEYIDNCYSQIMTGYDGDNQFLGETLFIKGGNSNYITAEHRERINQLFPNVAAKIIQGAGHWLHAEKTTAFNKIVRDFLAK
ncbi:alpha/beta fold hydrolase [Thalassotalea sp. LPB0316]|nr:alpha/beta fold hydrolase [Thalassotalea sp. LPB0316]